MIKALERSLNKYYEKCGISALKFDCKHYKVCKSRCKDTSKFTKAKEPYIGAFYGKKNVPKLLFLSLDSGGEKKRRKTRTIEAVRKNTLRLTNLAIKISEFIETYDDLKKIDKE